MSKWRVQVSLAFGNTADRDLYKDTEGIHLAGKSIFDTVSDVVGINRDGKPSRNLITRFNTQADADNFYAAIQTFMKLTKNLPMGFLPIGKDIVSADEIVGKASNHLCFHDEAESNWRNCRTGAGVNYTETVK